MEVDRSLLIEFAAAGVPVIVLTAAFAVIGTRYTSPGTGLTPEGGQMLVAVLAGFVVLMFVIGVLLSRWDYDAEE